MKATVDCFVALKGHGFIGCETQLELCFVKGHGFSRAARRRENVGL
jgi:cold shock CspA family protein